MIKELPKTKVCSKCKVEKALSEFHKNKNTADGFAAYCKKCIKIINKKYFTENKEKIFFCQKKYKTENKEKVKESRRKYETENKEKIKESKRKWNIENKDSISQVHKKWVSENKKKVLEIQKKYRTKNRDKLNKKERQSTKNLSNHYVLSQLKYQLPNLNKIGEPEQKALIEFKRAQLLLTREIRKQQNAN